MKEPSYDDSLMPALGLLLVTALFAAICIGFLWLERDWATFVPPSSTLPPLPSK